MTPLSAFTGAARPGCRFRGAQQIQAAIARKYKKDPFQKASLSFAAIDVDHVDGTVTSRDGVMFKNEG